MEFELFDKIYTTILKHSEQKDKISDFIEEKFMHRFLCHF